MRNMYNVHADYINLNEKKYFMYIFHKMKLLNILSIKFLEVKIV